LKYFPDFVYHDEKSDRYLVYYDKLTTVLLKGIQEQQSEIELLKSENSNLKNNNEVLSNDIKTMKAQIDVINEQLHIKTQE
jgi:predicted RNase H-like nuclease (RuvC/YqgF family)